MTVHVPELVIDDMDRFFATQWQQLADDITREPKLTPLLQAERDVALEKADFYRKRLAGAQ